MRHYEKPEMRIVKFESSDAFAATGEEIFGTGEEVVPVSEFTYNGAESNVDGWLLPGMF